MGLASGAVADKSLQRIAVDTTVMEKNIAHPTDARLCERARALLAAQVGRYAHARQFKRQLKGYAGRVRC